MRTETTKAPASVEEVLERDGRYVVEGWPGVAVWAKRGVVDECALLRLLEADEFYLEDGGDEPIEDDRVVVVMVGDDAEHVVDLSDLRPIEDEDYCSVCGQIGCGHG